MIAKILLESLKIIGIVALLMMLVEFFQIKYKDKIREKLTKKPLNQYTFSSLFGAIPGCTGTFAIVSTYIHGAVGFGALAAVMISTAGDEAFVMLAMVLEGTMILETVLLIFAICAILGIVGGFIADKIIKKLNVKTCSPCFVTVHKKEEIKHFFVKHVWEHLIKRHIPKLFLWIFFALLAVEILMANFNLEAILPSNMLLVLILAALIGIIPESGPHLIFLALFAQGIVPFSVLLTSSIVQDGHGLLPLLSYSVKDTVYVKLFNVAFGLIIGLALFAVGF